MNNIENKINELFDELEKSEVYIKYLKVKKQLEEDSEIKEIIEDIRKYQKIVVNNKDNSVEEKLKELYSKLDKIPLYQSYLIIKEELNEELFIIKEIFEKYFKELLSISSR